jgi:hypothetical protein
MAVAGSRGNGDLPRFTVSRTNPQLEEDVAWYSPLEIARSVREWYREQPAYIRMWLTVAILAPVILFAPLPGFPR